MRVTVLSTRSYPCSSAASWTSSTSGYTGTAPSGDQATVPVVLGGRTRIAATAWNEVSTTVRTSGVAGLVFDRYADGRAKVALLDVPGQRVLLGHLDRGTLVVDTAVARSLAGIGGRSKTRSAPKWARKAAATVAVAPSSFRVSGNWS